MALKLRRIQCVLRKYSSYASETDLPRVTVPQKMILNLEKKQIKAEIENKKKHIKFKSPLIISCKRKQYNHYKGQTYSDFDPKVLASHGWKHKESAGDYFTINCYQKNPALQDDADGDKLMFTDFDISPDFLPVLDRMNVTCPTMIQSKTIPVLLRGDSVQLSAETGSGKTLAYLLPIMELISRQKKYEAQHGGNIPPNSPRCIILVPTKELVNQVKDVVDKFASEMNFTVLKLNSSHRYKEKLQSQEQQGIDILISSPRTLNRCLASGSIQSSYSQYVVLDEADTLLDDSFNSDIRSIVSKLGVAEKMLADEDNVNAMQYILVSATLPRGFNNVLGDRFPVETLERISTNSVHRLMPHVPQKFIRLKPSQKAEEIIMMSRKLTKTGTPGMIFCNELNTSLWLSKFLEEQSIDNILLNSRLTSMDRKGVFERFQNGESDILVCTDIASRGLDTLRVEHVINYEFPNFMSDYLHRAGRVGRVSSKNHGQVTSFVTYSWEVDLLWHIETAARKSQELHNVNANIKRKLVSRSYKN